ncbi:MAG: hypothetical protein RMJ37_02965 [Spirochaetia bacterium]|nr:hypothetical protein [Spirochaetota bacterium]MCX8096352.1 hypothetical protein [Spirochaetota bacterium]MDW8112287.1 hypothetical protein [Spirochaetia bacterium]
MNMIFRTTLIVILSITTTTLIANPAKPKNFIFNHNTQRLYLSYSSGMFKEETYEVMLSYINFSLSLINKNYGEITIIDDQGNINGSAVVYDLSTTAGYSVRILDNLFTYASLLLDYEYYYFFSDIYVGGGIGVGFNYGGINTFNILEFRSYSTSFEGVVYNNFQNIVILGIGYNISYYYQDLFLFIISKIFEYSGVRMNVMTSIMYGTTKGFIPYFEASVGYYSLSIGYGLSIHQSMGISQFWFLESKI